MDVGFRLHVLVGFGPYAHPQFVHDPAQGVLSSDVVGKAVTRLAVCTKPNLGAGHPAHWMVEPGFLPQPEFQWSEDSVFALGEEQ